MQNVRRRGNRERDVYWGNTPGGYAGLRGGQARPGMYPSAEETGVSGMMPHAGIYSQMYPRMYAQGPNTSPHAPVPPQYASHESKRGYGHHDGNVYAAQPARPPPPSASSSSSSSGSRSRPLPSEIQAAVDEAIQKSTGAGGGSRNPLDRSKTSPLFIKRDNSKDSCGDGIDTCICTTNCNCRRGERAVKWYEGMADIGGKEVPVRARLNTRFVLRDDIGKDCGDHSGCRKKTDSDAYSTSSSSDIEACKSKHSKKSKKKVRRPGKAEKLDALQAELERVKQTAAKKQGWTYNPSPFLGYDPRTYAGYNLETMNRIMETCDPYEHYRVGGMEPRRKLQGTYDPMTTRNPRSPRMPPRPGMRKRSQNHRILEDYEEMGGTSPYVRASVLRSKGKHADLGQAKRRPRFGLRQESSSDSEPSTLNCSRDSKEGGPMTSRPKSGRTFELDDTDVSLGPRRQSAMRGLCSDGGERPALYNLSGKSCIIGVFCSRPAETPIERGEGEKNGSASSRGGWPRTSPSGRRGGVRKGQAAGKQARAETDDDDDDDDEDY